MGALTKHAVGSCSWVTQPLIQLEEAVVSCAAEIIDIRGVFEVLIQAQLCRSGFLEECRA